jgi:3-oxoacyl-[acyl-carrier protein] reductase
MPPITLDLAGHVALVTGASRLVGIGAAICRTFADAGADIAFTHWTPYDRASFGTTDSEPRQLEAELRETGVRAVAIEMDLSDPASPFALLDEVEERIGTTSILVNNAAVSINDAVETLTAENLDRHYAVNVRAMALLSVEFSRRFSGPSGGRIINMTSGQGVGPMPNELSYITTKGAIEAFTTSFAYGVASRGITVNAVDPGATDTGWMPPELKAAIQHENGFDRVGEPEDAARLITFLASDAGSWITGQVIHSRGA